MNMFKRTTMVALLARWSGLPTPRLPSPTTTRSALSESWSRLPARRSPLPARRTTAARMSSSLATTPRNTVAMPTTRRRSSRTSRSGRRCGSDYAKSGNICTLVNIAKPGSK